MMRPKTHLLVLSIIVSSKVFAKECPGKIISNYVCIPPNYVNSNDESPEIPPNNDVNVSLIDVQVVKFDDLVEKLTLKMTLKMKWLDNRLQLTKETSNNNANAILMMRIISSCGDLYLLSKIWYLLFYIIWLEGQVAKFMEYDFFKKMLLWFLL